MSQCCGLMGLIFGHKFQARYDESEVYQPDTAKVMDLSLSRITGQKSVLLPDDVNAIEHITDGYRQLSTTISTYVQDVCVRCGEVQERQGGIKVSTPPTSFAEHFYKDRKEKWEQAKAYAAADPLRVACIKCFHVFNKRNAADKTVICPACSYTFDVAAPVSPTMAGLAADEAKQDDMPEEHKTDGKAVKTCPACFHTWRVHPTEAFQGCPVCRDREAETK